MGTPRSKDQNRTFLVPLHADSVGLEEALVGERSGGSSQDRVLVQTDKGRRSFAARDVNHYLDRKRTGPEGPGSGLKLFLSLCGGLGSSSPCWAELQVTTGSPTPSACAACWRCCLKGEADLHTGTRKRSLQIWNWTGSTDGTTRAAGHLWFYFFSSRTSK